MLRWFSRSEDSRLATHLDMYFYYVPVNVDRLASSDLPRTGTFYKLRLRRENPVNRKISKYIYYIA